ncbi:hypothetical protein QWA68_004061 [Fusarium oxysporum]|nr:hypothetical protein QWA68_004061 [Fusarium oxysporum]
MGLSFSPKSQAGNGASGYEEAVGAPFKTRSPLRYHVNWLTIIFLNLNHMVGTGIFSTPATILSLIGSVGLALVY